MSDGITDNVTYSHQSFSDWKKREIQTFLSLRSTKELVDELSRREGVQTIEIPDDEFWWVQQSCGWVPGKTYKGKGAARILVVK